MGCGGSKLEEMEAVALCRDRSGLLADAIRYRYALADAHAAYARALRSAGSSLHDFLDALRSLPPPDASPFLPLPAQRKGDPLPPPSPLPPPAAAGGHAHSHSHSGSHLHFHSSDEDSDDDSPLHSTNDSPIHLHSDHHEAPATGATFVNYNYARNTPAAASVAYEQRPQSPEAVRFNAGEPPSYFGYQYPVQSSNSYPYPAQSANSYPYPAQSTNSYPYAAQSSNSYPYPYAYPPNYASYEGMGGFFGSASSPPSNIPPHMAVRGGPDSPSTYRAPPPPPSPPKASTWDFLNPFSYDNYTEELQYPYTPSRSSKEVREEEGIPDLEDEEHEVVKEAYSDPKEKFAASTSAAMTGKYPAKAADTEEGIGEAGEEAHYKPRKSAEASSSTPDSEVHVVDKNVVADKEVEQQNAGAVAPSRRYHNLSEVVNEIKAQFDKASGSFEEVSTMLEVGKIPYNQKNSVYEASTRMICGVISPSTTKNEVLEFEEDKGLGSGYLSSTLQKLYMWEQKLLDEVKVEEKMRIVLERECEHLRRLDERGAESHKLESTQILIRKLSTKIRIAIQVVESISNKISKLRDEELWPQISELIQGLMRMWRVMLECHRIQCQAISAATLASGGKLNEAHMEATKKLELELLGLIACFSAWISAQKSFVKALNGWLIKGLHYVPEETPDGIAPFSPGRLGAPPLFVICNYWSQTINRISEREVVNAMQAFASNVYALWEQQNSEQRQRLMANKDMDKTLRIMEKEELQIRRAVEAQNKKLVLVSGQSGLTLSEQVHHGHTAEVSSLQLNLRQIFEAMENFTATSLKAYEELHTRSEEERSASENSKVP